MANYRNSKLIERYEDVVFELDYRITAPANGAHQLKNNHRFTINNEGETTPFDWYNARFNVDFKLQKLADGTLNDGDHDSMVNSAFSLIKRLNVKMNGVNVYDCSDANHATNIKKTYLNTVKDIPRVRPPMSSSILTQIEIKKKDRLKRVIIQDLL